jgi:hypothetical protein
MNATVTKAASRSSHGAAGQMVYAVAKASKAHEDAVSKVEALAQNIVAAAKQQPAKLYRVDQLAEELGLSVSWVNMQLAKDKPDVLAVHGKSHFYGEDYLDTLRQRGARPRARRVQIIRQSLAAPVQKKVKQTKNIVSTLADISNQSEPLFQRLARMEQETKHVEDMLVKISKFLGLE